MYVLNETDPNLQATHVQHIHKHLMEILAQNRTVLVSISY